MWLVSLHCGQINSVSEGFVYVCSVRGSTPPKFNDNNSTYHLLFFNEGDKSLYFNEDISQGYVHCHFIEWFNSPCTEGIIFEDVSHNCNYDLIRGLSFNL